MATVVCTGTIPDLYGIGWKFEIVVSSIDPNRLVWSLQSPPPGASIRAVVADPWETVPSLVEKMEKIVASSAAN